MKPKDKQAEQEKDRHAKGFTHAAAFVKGRFRTAAAKRGFASTRILTHWPEVAGAEIAAMSQPMAVRFDKAKRENVLTLLTTGAFAQQLSMSAPLILERVNAEFGFRAVDRVRVTQSWKGQRAKPAALLQPVARQTDPPGSADLLSAEIVHEIEDAALRNSLSELGRSIVARSKQNKGEYT